MCTHLGQGWVKQSQELEGTACGTAQGATVGPAPRCPHLPDLAVGLWLRVPAPHKDHPGQGTSRVIPGQGTRRPRLGESQGPGAWPGSQDGNVGESGILGVSAFLIHLSLFVLSFRESCLWGDLMIKASDIICQAGEKCTFLCFLFKTQETSANNDPKT